MSKLFFPILIISCTSSLFAMEKYPEEELLKVLIKNNAHIFEQLEVASAALATAEQVKNKKMAELANAQNDEEVKSELLSVGLPEIMRMVEIFSKTKKELESAEQDRERRFLLYGGNIGAFLQSTNPHFDADAEKMASPACPSKLQQRLEVDRAERALRDREAREDRERMMQRRRFDYETPFERAQAAVINQHYEKLLEVMQGNKLEDHEIEALLGAACEINNAEITQVLVNKIEAMQGSSQMGGFGKTNNPSSNLRAGNNNNNNNFE